MTAPVRSPIADAAAAALAAHEQSTEVQQQLLTAARTKLAELLPGLLVESLEASVEDAGLVVVTDGAVHVGVRSDGEVCVVRRTGAAEWTETKVVRTGVELAQALPAEVMGGRRRA